MVSCSYNASFDISDIAILIYATRSAPHPCSTLSKILYPQCNHGGEKTSNQPKLRDTLKDAWPVLPKTVRVTKNKAVTKGEETKEMWQQNAIRCPGLDPGTERRHWKSLNKIWSLVNSNIPIPSLVSQFGQTNHHNIKHWQCGKPREDNAGNLCSLFTTFL